MVCNIATQDGIQAALQRRTLARVLRMHREAMHPKPVKDMEALISHIVEWEDRWNRMEKEHKGPTTGDLEDGCLNGVVPAGDSGHDPPESRQR